MEGPGTERFARLPPEEQARYRLAGQHDGAIRRGARSFDYLRIARLAMRED